MAQIIIDINDANIADVRDTLAIEWGYPTTVANPLYDPEDGGLTQPTIPNPQSKVQFLKAYIASFIKTSYRNAKANQEGRNASATSLTNTSNVDIS